MINDDKEMVSEGTVYNKRTVKMTPNAYKKLSKEEIEDIIKQSLTGTV